MIFKAKIDEVKEYTEKLREEIDCEKLTFVEEIREEQKNMLAELSEQDIGATIFYALCIGFANGVKWERK